MPSPLHVSVNGKGAAGAGFHVQIESQELLQVWKSACDVDRQGTRKHLLAPTGIAAAPFTSALTELGTMAVLPRAP